jgi:predicted RND superfamily exporter protein
MRPSRVRLPRVICRPMRFVHRGILIAVLAVVSRPRTALLVSGVILAVCLLIAWAKLDISTDQNKLFDPNVSFFRDYLHFVEIFPENEAIYVVIEAKDSKNIPPVLRWIALADEIARKLRRMPDVVRSVDSRVPIDQLGSQGLLFDEPALVHQSFDDIQRFIPLVKLWGEKPSQLTRVLGKTPLERFVTGLQTQTPDEETAEFVTELAESWERALAHPDQPLVVGNQVPDLAAMGATDPSRLGYYYVPDDNDHLQHVMLVRVYHEHNYTSLTAVSETVQAIRHAVRDAAKGFDEFTVGVTGRPALAADEMRTTDQDSHKAEVFALIAVFIGLVVMLRSIWLAIAGEIALGVGIGWTFGWATVSVGELNLLSIVFLLALIGIGMDYLVQILTRYRQQVLRRPGSRNIWVGVFRGVAAPINTACLGAAGAFLVSVFTKFRGAAQLGIIAGGGLLLCLISGYVVLPALLTLIPPRLKQRPPTADSLGRPARGSRWNLLMPAIWLTLLVIGAPFAARTDFDPNLLKMQSQRLESVKLVRKLETWSAVVLSKDLDVLRRARVAVRHSPLVERTDSILLAYDNLDWLRQHEAEIPEIDWTEPAPIDANDLSRLAGKVKSLSEHFKSFESASRPLAAFADQLNAAAKSPSATAIAKRLSDWQVAFITQLQQAIAPFHPGPLEIDKLPAELKSHYVSSDGTFALYIYPEHDLWKQADLAAFVHDVESRMKAVAGPFTLTGIALNIFHSTSSIERSFYEATAYALALIFLLVLIDLRHITQTLFAISVLALGLPMLVAIMGLFGVDWNFANFFGLPILIGAGHEYGVFLVHRYREALREPRRVWRRWDVSDRALLLCAYVTCTSFGFFWALAHHRGLRSLGLVMALGTACIYLAAVMVLRPLLVWRLVKREKKLKSARES